MVNEYFNSALRIKDFPSEEKPRERLAKYGQQALSNSELLAIILGKGTASKNVIDLSKEILLQYNLKELSMEGTNALREINGIGTAKACQIVACFELGRRLSAFSEEQKPMISCAEDVYTLVNPRLRLEKKEHLIGLFLDTRKRLIKEEVIFIGTLDSSIIHPREILKSAIKASCAAMIIVHNHPSGDPKPSQEDVLITRQIANAGSLVGIPLLDHVVIGETRFVSLRNANELKDIFI